jgi:hypothetical protein
MDHKFREVDVEMKSKILRSAAGAVVALFFVCGPIFAKTSHVDFIYLGKVGQLTLAPGKYTVRLNRASATPEMAFYKNGKFIGQTPVRVVSEARKNGQTQVYYNAPKNNVRRVTQIDLSGWKDKLIVPKHAA